MNDHIRPYTPEDAARFGESYADETAASETRAETPRDPDAVYNAWHDLGAPALKGRLRSTWPTLAKALDELRPTPLGTGPAAQESTRRLYLAEAARHEQTHAELLKARAEVAHLLDASRRLAFERDAWRETAQARSNAAEARERDLRAAVEAWLVENEAAWTEGRVFTDEWSERYAHGVTDAATNLRAALAAHPEPDAAVCVCGHSAAGHGNRARGACTVRGCDCDSAEVDLASTPPALTDRAELVESIEGIIGRCRIDGLDPAPELADAFAILARRHLPTPPALTVTREQREEDVATHLTKYARRMWSERDQYAHHFRRGYEAALARIGVTVVDAPEVDRG